MKLIAASRIQLCLEEITSISSAIAQLKILIALRLFIFSSFEILFNGIKILMFLVASDICPFSLELKTSIDECQKRYTVICLIKNTFSYENASPLQL